MCKKINLLLLLLSFTLGTNAQVKWYNIEEAQKEAAAQHKKIMVKVYARWCGWCKEMDKSTFPNPHVAKILNESFIPVQFNSEQKTPVIWSGKEYKLIRPKNSGPYHALAATWLNGKLSFPTIVILDENGNVIQSIAGYRKASEFEKIIAFFASNNYKTTNWDVFVKNYKR